MGPFLSRDGTSILFTDLSASTRDSGPFVSLRGTDGSPPQRLGEGIAEDLSPDGKWALAFLRGPPVRIVVYPTGTGEPIVLPNGPIERHVQAGTWFPDGRRVLVCGNEPARPPRCYAQDVAGGMPKPVTPEGVLGAWVSPDGRRLLAQGPDGTWQIVPIEGALPPAPRGLRLGDIVAGWSNDGESALVTAAVWNVPSRLERVNLTTGARTLIKELAPADHAGLTYALANMVRNDGREYAYGYGRVLSTLYQIDGLNLSAR
jgi:eukaryotic-like serine/threonine-protein kinase